MSYTAFQLSSPAESVRELSLASGKGNPMTAAFWNELPQVMAELAADKSVRAVLVTAQGPHFSYGLDLMGMGQVFMQALNGKLSGRQMIVEQGQRMQEAFNAIARCPKPVIAAVQGWCIGGGVELIAACDVRLAAADARFALKEVNIGIVPDLGGIQRLPYVISEGALREMAMSGGEVSAARALALGLVSQVQESAATTREAALALAVQMAANPPSVVAGIKQVMNARIEAAIAAGLKEALQLNSSMMQSEDFKEAIAAFAAKRAPRFTGH